MFKPMLAKDGDPAKLSFPVVAQPKLDGIRVSIVDGRALTRTLKQVPNAEVYEALSRPEFEGLDGEVIVGDPLAPDAYRKTASFVMAPNKTGEPWALHVFDKHDEPGGFWNRYNAAREAIFPTGEVGRWAGATRLCIVQSENIPSLAELEAFEASYVAKGGEGIIVRTLDDAYKFGRSGSKGPLLKVKRFIDFEAVVIGVYEQMHNANEAKRNALGRTERSTAQAGLVGAGVLGGLELRALNGPAAGVEFRCGTGFDAAMRADLWQRALLNGTSAGLTGLHAKIKSFPIGVKDKPRFPVFLGWRDLDSDGGGE